ncbi:MAG: hypothetical protein V4615_17205 [Bacteroidota bacterium]
MRKKILQDQNKAKALEIRLESDGNRTYNVIVAGMTVKLMSACARGICEPTGENEYLDLENEVYSFEIFSDYPEAKEKYDVYKTRYINS